MKHPLDGARFKVVWAEKHLDSLKTEIGSYLSRHVNEVSSQPSRQPQHTWMNPIYTFPPIIPAQTELTLSAIIGDIITNARAALDYVMWELATKYFQPPLRIDKFADRKLASFPISNDPIEIKKCSDGLENRKLPTGAIHEIKAVQPYNAGYEPLWRLTDLVNRDKHRMFLLTVGAVESVTVRLSSWPLGPLRVGEDTITIPRSDLAASGNPTIQSDVQMKAKPTIQVTWKDVPVPSEPVERTLEQIVKCVAHVIPRFDRFFI